MFGLRKFKRVGCITSIWQSPDAGRKEGSRGRGRERGREIHLPVTEIPVNLRTYPREYLQNLLLFYYLLEKPLRRMVTLLLRGLNWTHFLRLFI